MMGAGKQTLCTARGSRFLRLFGSRGSPPRLPFEQGEISTLESQGIAFGFDGVRFRLDHQEVGTHGVVSVQVFETDSMPW